MSAITQAIIEKYYPRGKQPRILDAGCGTGGAIKFLSRYGKVIGFDISEHALRFCQGRGVQNIARASVMDIPFADETFDLVIALDVLYFVNIDDEAALREFYRTLVPGGRLVIRVPAFNWLRGIHDIKVATGHRYTLKELTGKIERNGLLPEFISYTNALLFPLIVLKRVVEKWLPPQADSDITINVGHLRKLFEYCLVLESHFIKKHSLPFGVSVIAAARKPL